MTQHHIEDDSYIPSTKRQKSQETTSSLVLDSIYYPTTTSLQFCAPMQQPSMLYVEQPGVPTSQVTYPPILGGFPPLDATGYPYNNNNNNVASVSHMPSSLYSFDIASIYPDATPEMLNLVM